MTGRERLFAALAGKPTDRTPIWLLFPYHRAGYYVDVRTNPCYTGVFEKSKECAVMLNRRNPRVSLFAPEVVWGQEKCEQDGWSITRTTLSYGGKSLVGEYRQKGEQIEVKKLLAGEEDLELLLTFPINDCPKRIAAELDRQEPAYLAERADFPEHYGSMMLDLGEPIGFLYGHSDLQEFAVWSLVCSEKVEQFLHGAMRMYRELYRQTLQRNWAEVYFMVGSELASPPLVSRETFQRWIVPFARELIEMIHQHNKFVIQHYHGHIKLILEDFLTMGPDALHTIEAPPTGNCTLTEAYAVLGDRITLIGNVQYDLFRSMSPDQMRQEVRNVLDEVNGRRFILSPSAGPYEETIAPRVTENYLAFLEAGWNYKETR